MANTLTGLVPTIYEALDAVSRELVGFIPGVWRNPEGKNLQRAAKGQTITFPITPQGTLEDITPGVNPASSGSQTIGNDTLSISKAQAYPILWNGEEQLSLANGDTPRMNGILRDQFTQGFRTIANAIEADLAALYVAASRSVGTAGTLPFNTANKLDDIANSLRIMNENGAGSSDLHMVLGNSSAANLRGVQSSLFKVNEAGDPNFLRNGTLGRVQNFAIGESNQIAGHTKGTGSGYLSNLGATLPIGSTDIILDTGSGTVLAGDTVTFAGDTNKYVVTTGVSAPGTITIAEPGLRLSLANDVAMTIGATSNEQNMFFARSAMVLVTRMPAMPAGGDSADDVMTVVDPFTGLAFEIAMYKQYKQVKYEIGLAWGVKAVKPEHMGLLLA